MHGKVSRITHDGTGIFAGLPSPLHTARYHSLVIDRATIPASLRITATSEDGEIMAVQHRTCPVVGVQFHPESALSEHGYAMLDTFLHGPPSPGDIRRAGLPDRADGQRSGEASLTSGERDNEEGGGGPELHIAPPPATVVR
jgi:hypothetical protein